MAHGGGRNLPTFGGLGRHRRSRTGPEHLGGLDGSLWGVEAWKLNPSTGSGVMLPGCQHAWPSPCPAWERGPFWKTPLPSDENPPTLQDLRGGAGESSVKPSRIGYAQRSGPTGQRGLLPQRPVMGRLICIQGPPKREPLPPTASVFEQKLCFSSVLVSLSRSELDQGQEQRHVSPIQHP